MHDQKSTSAHETNQAKTLQISNGGDALHAIFSEGCHFSVRSPSESQRNYGSEFKTSFLKERDSFFFFFYILIKILK